MNLLQSKTSPGFADQTAPSLGFVYFFVFITGSSVMAIEMTASRLIAPYFGTSLIVWANIIGLIMLALSLGYYIGGKLADRYPAWSVMFTIPLLAGLFASVVPLFSRLVLQSLAGGILGTPLGVIAVSFFGILVVFTPPVFLLAMISPYAVRMAAVNQDNAGQVAGTLYACSTVGSILGTFLPSFVTIPFLGSRETLLLFGGLLILLSVVGQGARKLWLMIFLAVPLVIYLLTAGSIKPTSGLLYEKDTLYQYVQVVRQADGSTALVYNEGGGIQSIRRPGDQLMPDLDYYDYYLLLSYFQGQKDPRVMVVGSAGGTILHLLNTYNRGDFPQMSLAGVEIDPAVTKLGYQFFGLRPEEASVATMDGRAFFRTTNQQYDLIIVDAYSQQIYIPFHLTTSEFFSEIKGRLSDRGMLALNVNATTKDSRLLQSISRTVAEVFPYTYSVKVGGSYNYMVIGSLTELRPEVLTAKTSANPQVAAMVEPFQAGWQGLKADSLPFGQRLTDNRAPVEFLTDEMIWQAAKNR